MSRSNQTLLIVMAMLAALSFAVPATATEIVSIDPWVEPTVPEPGSGGSSSGEPDVGQVTRTGGGSTTTPDVVAVDLGDAVMWARVILTVRYLGITF